MNFLDIALYVLAGIGVLTIVLFGWIVFSNPKTEVTEKEPEYTEEEKLYAELLLMKHDIDADAFATKKQMMEEINAQNQEGSFYEKMKDAFGSHD